MKNYFEFIKKLESDDEITSPCQGECSHSTDHGNRVDITEVHPPTVNEILGIIIFAVIPIISIIVLIQKSKKNKKIQS